jgi:hypothetical protein
VSAVWVVVDRVRATPFTWAYVTGKGYAAYVWVNSESMMPSNRYGAYALDCNAERTFHATEQEAKDWCIAQLVAKRMEGK